MRRKVVPPLPGQVIEEEEDDGGIDFEAAAIAFLCLVVCILFYYRTEILARAVDPPPADQVHPPNPNPTEDQQNFAEDQPRNDQQ